VAVAQSNPNFSTLVAAVTRANLAGALQAATPAKTVFAPNNAAFQALFTTLGVSGVNDLSVDQLTVILRYHVLPTEQRAAAVLATATANGEFTALGGKIRGSLQGTTIRLDASASVVTPDVLASNGVIHEINAVLLPSVLDVATTDDRFTSLTAAVLAANISGLTTTLDNNALTPKLTVFAPTNAAFDTLVNNLRGTDDGGTTGITGLTSFTPAQLAPVLSYHVVATGQVLAAQVPATGTVTALGGRLAVTRTGSNVTVDGVPVAIADIITANGVIHAIGSVLLPSITDIATTTPALSSLTSALVLADSLPDGGSNANGLVSTLDAQRSDGGLFTVFAPVDTAFAATVSALRGTDDGGTTGITSLSSFSVAQVTPILTYHVAPNRIFASQVPTTAAKVPTLGGTVSAVRGSSGVTIDGTSVTTANIFASNGVVHLVNGVLLPSITDLATTTPSLSSLTAALVLADSLPDGGTNANGLVAAFDTTRADGGTYTVIAPSNAAFATTVGALSANPATGITGLSSFSVEQISPILRYHAIPSTVYASQVPASASVATLGGGLQAVRNSSGVTFDGRPVVTANLFASNGVVHVINQSVLLPSIADVVTTEPSLSSLAGLVTSATGTPSVAAALDGTTNFTLFAPNNAAVAAVPSASVPSGQNLTNLLLLHAGTQVSSTVTSPIYAATVLGLGAGTQATLATALTGRSLAVGPLNGTVRVFPIPTSGPTPPFDPMYPRVVTPNLFTSNGVIHVINQVLLP
jgi:transforming growth factor-beta-induced protein